MKGSFYSNLPKLKFMQKVHYVCFILISIFSTQVTIAQNNPLETGIRQFEMKNYDQAKTAFEAYLAAVPTDVNVMSKLAACYKNLNMTDKALALYKQTTESKGFDTEVYFEYGELLRSEAEFELAKIQFNKYAAFNPAVGHYFSQSCDYALTQLKSPSNCNLKNLETNGSKSEVSPTMYKDEIIIGDNRTTDQSIKSAPTIAMVKANSLLLSPNAPSQVSEVLSKEALGKGNMSFNGAADLVVFSKGTIIDITGKANTNGALAIYFADVNTKGSWSKPSKFKYCDARYSYGFPNITNDGKTLFFASNMPGGFGGYDLYISNFVDGEWTIPENLGSVINTPGNEISPNLDHANLYFSSDWHKGFGGFDVFRVSNKMTTWSDVINLGTCVNSTKDDYNFLIDNEGNGYFTSNRNGGKGGDDVYKASKLAINNITQPSQIRNTDIGVKSPLQAETKAAQLELNDLAESEVYDDPELFGKSYSIDEKVYFIQITAISNYSEAIESRFKKYAKYGDVFKIETDGVVKIRIGVFKQLNAALTQLKELRKTGLKDAFVVADIFDEKRMIVIAKAGSDFSNSQTTIATDENANKYKIRVAEFKAPDWFDVSKVNDLGKIEHWTKSGYTIIILGAYPTEVTAKDVLSKIKARGYKDAYVVTEEDGKLYRIN